MNDKSLRETAERIIEGVPISYRDGDEVAGRERTVKWLMDLLRERGELMSVLGVTEQKLANKLARAEADTKTTIRHWQSKLLDEICDKLGCPRDAEALLIAVDRKQADTKRLDWLESNLLHISHGRSTCSVDMGGRNIHGQLQSGQKKFKVYHATIREAIDAAMKEGK